MELWQIFIRWLGQRASFLSTFLILSGECQPLPRVPRPRRREHGCPSSVCTPPLRSPSSPAAHALGGLSEESRVLHIHSAQQSSTILLLFCMSFPKTCSPHHGGPLTRPILLLHRGGALPDPDASSGPLWNCGEYTFSILLVRL